MAEGAGTRRRRRARYSVSRLTVTIFLANVIALAILLVGSFGLTQFRDGLIQAKLQGVRAQAQIIADVLAQTAIDETTCQPVEEGDLARIGESGALCALSLDQGDVNEIFNRVWDSFEGRVRIFKAPQTFETPPVGDASELLLEDVVLRRDIIVTETLAPIEEATTENFFARLWAPVSEAVGDVLSGNYRRNAARRSIEGELNDALASSPFAQQRGATSVRLNEDGELVASVSVPIRKVQAIYGIVTAEIGGIDALVSDARLAILPFFGLASTAAILSSLLLTAAIAQPIRQLVQATDKVREGISAAGRARIPDFSHRRDEIGELSLALRLMTQSIYARIEAIESFAADVAHELKNPLTSIRSAIETLDIAVDPAARAKLMSVVKKDVARMDRLITDISNASRLDAELARQTREAVDLRKLLADIVDMYAATLKDGQSTVRFEPGGPPAYINGNPATLSQVFRNLIDNARSFSPPGGEVRLLLDEDDQFVRVTVEDDGPGIPPDSLEKVFDRFYTKRPAGAAFGNNSGLGLAICRQIVASHGGRIWAENRYAAADADETAPRLGARFIVDMPTA